MASRGTIAAAVITAVGAVTAAVLAVVLPKALDDRGGSEITTVQPGEMPGRDGDQVEQPQPPRPQPQPQPDPPQQVETQLFADKESAPVGATVLVSGKGFAPNETVEIRVSAQRVATPRAGQGGDFANVSIKVPEFFRNFAKPMQVDISATGRTSIRNARASLTISG